MGDAPRLADLEAFVAVVRAGSFTAAGEALRTDKARVSRQVSRLERTLGVQLLMRSTRSLALTDIGCQVHSHAVGVLDAVDATRVAAAKSRREPQGTLRVTAGDEFGLFVVGPWLHVFQDRYPEVSVEAVFTNRVVDIVHEGFDVAIRIGKLRDSTLRARRIGLVTYGFYASPAYLAAGGAPEEPRDLETHDFVGFSRRATPFTIRRGERAIEIAPKPRFEVNTNAVARQACAHGTGVALLPTFQAAPLVATGALRPVLDGWACAPAPVTAVFTSSAYVSPKVRAFLEVAIERFAGDLDGIPGDQHVPSGVTARTVDVPHDDP